MQKKYIVVMSICCVTLVGVGLGYQLFSKSKSADHAGQEEVVLVEEKKYKTLANNWNWAAIEQENKASQKDKPTSQPSDDMQYDVVAIHDALQEVRLNASGEVVLDEATLPALQDAFNRLGNDLTPEALAELQALVKIGLPGIAGEQVASILGRYHRYLQALDKNQSTKTQMVADGDEPASENHSIEAAELRLKELSSLRREVMGRDLSSQLYGPEEAQQRYLLSLQKIKNDESLSEDDRKAQLDRLKNDFDDGVMFVDQFSGESIDKLHAQQEAWQQLGLSEDIQAYLKQQTIGLIAARELATTKEGQADWESRYSQFQRERVAIVNAGLSEQDKQEQIEWLVHNYFSEEEITKSQNYLPHYVQ